jgi:hypothetical protein
MSRPRFADDFPAIRTRLAELRQPVEIDPLFDPLFGDLARAACEAEVFGPDDSPPTTNEKF